MFKKRYGFQYLVFIEFSTFWRPKTKPRFSGFRYFFDNADFMKIIDFFQEKQWFLRFGAFKNPCAIDAKARSKKASPKNLLKTTFGVDLGLRKPPKIIPKTFKIPSRSDVERSLFRDAMQLTRASAEVNGARSF